MTIPIQIEGAVIHGILDSGSETILMGANLLARKIPHWQDFPSVDGPTGGVGADGSEFRIIANKLFTFYGGGTYFKCPVAVANQTADCLLGLTFLREAKISMFFHNECIDIYMNNFKIESSRQKGESYDVFTLPYPYKIVLQPREMKSVKFRNLSFQNGKTYCIHSNALSWSIIIPTIEIAEHNTLNITLRNDSNKRIFVKPNTLLVDFEEKDNFDQVFNFQTPEIVEIFNITNIEKDIPIPFYNKDCHFNAGFYSRTPEYKVRHYFKNNIISASTEISEDVTPDASLLENLSELPGYEIDLDPLPRPDVNTIIEESLPQSLKSELRQFLVQLFSNYPGIIAKHNWDVGCLTNYKGEPVLLDIPLKSKLPIMNKAYALSKEDQAAISDIFDYLIFYGLALNCTVENQTGCPAFLVPRSDTNKSKRLVCDTRKTNTYISAPVSTCPTQVLTEIQNLLAERNYCSSLDIVNAYYTLRLGQSTLDSNISNVYTGHRCIKMLVALTGTSFIPLFFNKRLNEVLNQDDEGHFSPLNNRIDGYSSWFDDLYTVSDTEEAHKLAVAKLVHRVHRSGIKINLKKCFFFKNILEDDICILGHEIKKGSIVPEANKVKILTEFPTPVDRKSLQSFLGHLNFLRNLLPLQIVHLSTVLTPLTSPTVPYVWSEKHERCFGEIKSLLQSSANYLECPLRDPINIVYTDASESLLGGILFQFVPNKEIIRGHAIVPPNISFIVDADQNKLVEGGKELIKANQGESKSYKDHILHYNFVLGLASIKGMANLPVFQSVVRMILIATHWS